MAVYNTQQKVMLADFLLKNAEKPFSIEQLAAEISAEYKEKAPGKSTLYRLINKLVEEGTVKRFVKGNSRHFLYQFAGGEECHRHLHMKCTGCGKLLHMDHKQSEAIMSEILGNSDFAVDRERTTLFGLCKECKTNT